jgi:hypothetical protein
MPYCRSCGISIPHKGLCSICAESDQHDGYREEQKELEKERRDKFIKHQEETLEKKGWPK